MSPSTHALAAAILLLASSASAGLVPSSNKTVSVPAVPKLQAASVPSYPSFVAPLSIILPERLSYSVVPLSANPSHALPAPISARSQLDSFGVSNGYGPRNFNPLWDHEREHADAEADKVLVRKEEKRAQAARHAYAEPPALEDRPQDFREEDAREILNQQFDFSGVTKTGRELLAYLATPFAVVDGIAPDPARVDFSGFGVSDTELRARLEGSGVPIHGYQQFLKYALRNGLIYRLDDHRNKRTHHGLAHRTRALLTELSFDAPAAASPIEEAAPTSPLSTALAALATFPPSLGRC